MNPDAIAYLRAGDSEFAKHIDRIGPVRLPPGKSRDPFLALMEAIVFQQLAGAAARAIWGRVLKLFDEQTPNAELLLSLRYDQLRGAGLSRGKVLAMRDVAASKVNGIIPTSRGISRMSEAAIYERLTAIRGVGPWTVEMLLIFSLRRPDIMPTSDYGVRKGVQVLYRKRSLPTPNQVEIISERWRPHRTTAALYLWRIAEKAKPSKR